MKAAGYFAVCTSYSLFTRKAISATKVFENASEPSLENYTYLSWHHALGLSFEQPNV
jgi:hypothetical protein